MSSPFFFQDRVVFGLWAGCYHVALGWNGQPRRWLDEADGHGAQGSEIGTTARTGRRHSIIGSNRQVRDDDNGVT